ncbi:MAG: hypothetical protein ACREUF_06065, partial [Solimonas sp.]
MAAATPTRPTSTCASNAMSEPLDHQIAEGIAAALRQIRKANGYFTDAGLQVLSEEHHDEIDNEQIVLEVLDDDETAESQNAKRRKATLDLTIAVYYPAGEVDQALRRDARRVLADIRRALASIAGIDCPHGWINGVVGFAIAGRSIFVRDAGSRYFRPELKARVTFHENHRSNT